MKPPESIASRERCDLREIDPITCALAATPTALRWPRSSIYWRCRSPKTP